ncbi:MAG: hypothetical protein K0R50_4965 [Eubacterium sp.]|jgi:hypothetical protein|nr:hypothetical protein [Eubacterium sp.]
MTGGTVPKSIAAQHFLKIYNEKMDIHYFDNCIIFFNIKE